MLAVTLRGLGARKLRVALTLVAVALGVALISGTYVLTDTINSSFDKIFQTAAKGTDVSVSGREAVDTGDDGGSEPTLPASDLDRVRALPDVALAAGQIFDVVQLFDERNDKIGGTGAPSFVSSLSPDRFEPFDFVEGRAPRTADEVALDRSTADREKLDIGSTVKIAGAVPAKEFRIVGIGEFGGVSSFGGTTIAVTILPEAQRLTGNLGRFTSISIAAREGVTPQELRAEVRRVLPASARVETGQQAADRESQEIKDNLSFLTIALLAFAGIALFVGGFLIFNTFSIIVTQRLREFALLRTLGARRGQVLRSVLLEGALVGLVGSLIGLALGIGLAPGLRALFKAVGADLPSQGTVIATRTIVVSIAVGMIVTLVSGLFPALRATRIPPIAALREGAVLPKSRGARFTTPFALLLTALGVVALAAGLFGGASIALVGLGIIAVFLGVALLSPKLVPPLAGLVGRPLEGVFGITGRLARENAIRQPGRTAATAAALMVGVALVTFVSIFAAGAKASIEDAVQSAGVPGTLIVQNTDGFSPLPQAVGEGLSHVPGVEGASPVIFSKAKVAGESKSAGVTAIDPATFAQVYRAQFQVGSNATWARLGTTGVVLTKGYAEDHDRKVGDTLAITTPTGDRVSLRVVGISDDKGGLFADLTVSDQLARERFGERQDALVFLAVRPQDEQRVKAQVDALLERAFPAAEAKTLKQFQDDQAGQINQLVALIYVLLSLAVIVSLFGIVNTLALSIYERTRELGMMRAIGTTRKQVRRMIRYEAVITSLIGAVLGLVLGLIFAVAIAQPLKDDGFVLSIPVVTLLVLLILAAVAGVLAAIGPARRASRLKVLDALAYE